jgi:hypothetical protein
MKTLGERKRKYIYKNKHDKPNPSYRYHKNKISGHKAKRTYVNSHLNYINNDKNLLQEFVFPIVIPNTYNCSDCIPHKPKVYL